MTQKTKEDSTLKTNEKSFLNKQSLEKALISLSDAQKENSKLADKIKNIEQILSEAIDENSNFLKHENLSPEVSEENDYLKKKIRKLEKELEEKSTEIEKYENDLNNKCLQHENDIQTKNETIQKLTKQIDDLKISNSDDDNLRKMSERIELYKKAYEVIKTKAQEDSQSLNKQITSLEKTLLEIRKKTEIERVALEAEKEEYKNKFKLISDEYSNIKDSYKEQQKIIENLKLNQGRVDNGNLPLEDIGISAKIEIRDLKQNLANMNSNYKNALNKLDQKETEFKLALLKEQNRTKALDAELEKSKLNYDTLNNEYTNYKNKYKIVSI